MRALEAIPVWMLQPVRWRADPLPALVGNQILQPHPALGPAVLYTARFPCVPDSKSGSAGPSSRRGSDPADPAPQLDGSVLLRAFFLLHQQRTICTAQQSCGAGNRLKGIVCLLLSGVMDVRTQIPC